jgi:1-acyl-sn-glycerol-3-phosphate acyltransferase
MSGKQPSIKYPRRVVIRFFMRLLGRILMALLTRTTITGRENLPKRGPLILVGNHVAIVEVMMMALHVPWQVELIGTGDIPIDPRIAWLAKLWGYIPVNRGSVDRDEMRLPIDILNQNGYVGIFPEGGVWENSLRKARTGVAWLSYHTQTPILPIGFGGMRGALQAALAFKRPHLTMNIGHLIPAIDLKVEGMSRKEALQHGANSVMAQVADLIPDEEKRSWRFVQNERFDFKIVLRHIDGKGVVQETERTVSNPQALGKFFHRPVLLDVMVRNMKMLQVKPLQHLEREQPAQRIAQATQNALQFLDENPQFLNYRFGYDEATAMYQGIRELLAIAREAAENGYDMKITPIRRYRDAATDHEITQVIPGAMHEV